MLVTQKNFDDVLLRLSKENMLGFDTETTCLNWWRSKWNPVEPRVFSMQFATATEEFYFDFHHSAEKLHDEHYRKIHSALTSDPSKLWFIANAKFDMHHCANHGVLFTGTIHCTKAIARVVNNLEPSLKLDDLGERYLGAGKLDVKSLLTERGHITKIKRWGHNEKFEEILHFDRLELQELIDYGNKDTRLCYDLGVWQLKKVAEIDEMVFKDKPHKIRNVLKNEYEITKACFHMEREGVLIDREYTEKAYEHEVTSYKEIEEKLNLLAGEKLDWLSAKQLKPLFDRLGEPYSYTEKGNASFDRDALEESESDLAKLILRYRFHNKRAHTYFENFLWLADEHDVLHADAQQAGTGFGRMSYWTPNLQNVPKRTDKDESEFKVRRCFVPKPGGFFADIDYKGAEYFMTMDYAKEMTVIEELKAGLDPHKRLAAEMDLKDRDSAKTMQFRILYGGGKAAVGRALGYKGTEAERIGKQKKDEFFRRMPGVASWIRNVSGVAQTRGYIFNWLGRVLVYDRSTAYKASNGLIQGGVGDMTKVAMTNVAKRIRPDQPGSHRSRMLLQVHDAILFWIAYGEEHLIDLIKEDMRTAYPHKLLPMQVDASFSAKSWADLTPEIPSVA